MGFREMSAWASFGTTLVIFVPYFSRVWFSYRAGELDAGTLLGSLIGATVLQVFFEIGVHFAILTEAQEEAADELDRAIHGKAVRAAYWVLMATCSSLVICMVVVLPLLPAQFNQDGWFSPVLISQVFLACLVLAEAVRFLAQAVCYRRAA